MPIAYLVSRYPAPSHAFIQSEILALRERGMAILTVTVRRAENTEVLSPADRAENARTHSLLPAAPSRVLAAHLHAAARRPGRYLRTLCRSVAGPAPTARGRIRRLFYFAEAVLLWAWCRRERVRHVHVHFANPAADVAKLLVDFADDPAGERWSWSLTVHGPADLGDVTHNRLAEKVSAAASVRCISRYARGQVIALLPPEEWPKVAVVHCGVDPEVYRPASPGVQRNGSGPLRLLTVGRLVPVKGHAILLEALAVLLGDGHDAALTIIGEGPEHARLEHSVSRMRLTARVRLVGSLGQHELPGSYAEADVFCLPSLAEGLPVVLMEAMAMALPVVATRIAGIPELVEDGVNGRLVTPGSATELASAVADLAGDARLRRRLGDAARLTVLERFDVRANAQRLETILGRAAPAEAMR